MMLLYVVTLCFQVLYNQVKLTGAIKLTFDFRRITFSLFIPFMKLHETWIKSELVKVLWSWGLITNTLYSVIAQISILKCHKVQSHPTGCPMENKLSFHLSLFCMHFLSFALARLLLLVSSMCHVTSLLSLFQV